MTTERRHPNVVNQDEVQPREVKQGKHHVFGRRLADATGSHQLGASLITLPPGAISYPFHIHCLNVEAIYVVSGTGTTRIGDASIPVRPGDWIAFPIGPANAHQMINDGAEPLVYLCVSTDHKCEVVGYPDSNKILATGGEWQEPWVRQILRKADSLDYWDGEPNA